MLRRKGCPKVEDGLGFVSRASPVQTALRNCTGDEGGPLGPAGRWPQATV